MKLTIENLQEMSSKVILHRNRLSEDFQKAHKELNNQHSWEIKTISEYNFVIGQIFAFLKILKHLETSPNSLPSAEPSSIRSEEE